MHVAHPEGNKWQNSHSHIQSVLVFFNIYPIIMKEVENCSFPVLLVTKILMLKRL